MGTISECKPAAAQSWCSSHRCPQLLRHGVSPHRYACNSTSTVQAHFMLKLVSSILMGMRPFAKPLRWRSSSSSVTSKNLIYTMKRAEHCL